MSLPTAYTEGTPATVYFTPDDVDRLIVAIELSPWPDDSAEIDKLIALQQKLVDLRAAHAAEACDEIASIPHNPRGLFKVQTTHMPELAAPAGTTAIRK